MIKRKLNKIFIPTIFHERGYGFSFSKVHDEIFISFPSGALGSLKISVFGGTNCRSDGVGGK